MPHPDLNLYAIMAQLWRVNLGHIRGRGTESSRGGRWLKRITKHAAVLHPPTDTHRPLDGLGGTGKNDGPVSAVPTCNAPACPTMRSPSSCEGWCIRWPAAGEGTAETSQVSWEADAMWETFLTNYLSFSFPKSSSHSSNFLKWKLVLVK